MVNFPDWLQPCRVYLAFKRKFFLKIKVVEASTALAAGNCPQIVTNGDGKKMENLHYEVLICTILCINAIDFCNCMRYNAPVCATEFLYVRCCACINANSAKITDFIDIAVRLNLFNLFFYPYCFHYHFLWYCRRKGINIFESLSGAWFRVKQIQILFILLYCWSWFSF